jgi:hypothetical protein
MEYKLFETALAEASLLRPDRVNLFCYGEATLHPEIGRMIKATVDAGLRVRIHTNAFDMDEKRIRAILEAGLTEVHFSFDTADADLYNRMRVRSNFDTVVGNIRRFLQMKKDGNYQHPVVYCQELIPYVAGAEPQTTEAYRNLFAGENVIFDPRFMHNFAGGAKEKNFKFLKKQGVSRCAEIYTRIVVTFDGKMHACCLDAEGYNIAGDLSQGDSIIDGWNGEAMVRLRKLTSERKLKGLTPCDKCHVVNGKAPKHNPMRVVVGWSLWAKHGGRGEARHSHGMLTVDAPNAEVVAAAGAEA